MKKTLVLTALLALGTVASFGQGYVALYNSATTSLKITTNGVTSGYTSTAIGGNYFYAVLVSSTSLADNPNAVGWSVMDLYGTSTPFSATNYLTGGIQGNGGLGGTQGSGFQLNPGPAYANGTPSYYMIVGWSASLGKSTDITTILSDAANSGWAANGYFGYSAVGEAVAGNPAQSLASVDLLGNTSGINGYGLSSGFALNYVTPAPEPASMALFALSGASLLLFRRKK